MLVTSSISFDSPQISQGRSGGGISKGDLDADRLSEEVAGSEWPYVFSLPAFGALGDVELHGLTLLQALETTRLDGGEMYKNILSALTADEAVAFGVVEPLYCSLFCHIDTRVPSR